MRAQGFGIDREGFDAEMAQQKERARAAWKGSGAKASDEVWFDIAERVGSTEFTGYTASEGEGQVMALVKDGAEVQSAKAGDSAAPIDRAIAVTPEAAERSSAATTAMV